MNDIRINKGKYQLQIWESSKTALGFVKYAVYKRIPELQYMELQGDISVSTLDIAITNGGALLDSLYSNDPENQVIDEVGKRGIKQ